MPRVYAKKADGLRGRVTVPLSERSLERLQRYARQRAQPTAAVARELIERGLMSRPESVE